MTRFRSLILSAILGASLVACGSSSDDGAGGAGGGSAGGAGGSVGGAGGSVGGAGGTTEKAILDLVLKDNELPGWTANPANAKTRGKLAVTATDQATTEGYIDGAAADFFKAPLTPVMFAWQSYINTTLPSAPVAPDPLGVKVELYILQMPDAGQATSLYTSLLSAKLYAKWTWTDPSSLTGVDQSRVTNAGDTYKFNFTKGVYYVEVNLSPSYGPAPDYLENDQTLMQAAFDFAAAIAAKM